MHGRRGVRAKHWRAFLRVTHRCCVGVSCVASPASPRREPGDVVGAGVVDVDVVAALRGWIEQRPGEGEAVGAATLAGWYCPGWLAGWLAGSANAPGALAGVGAIRSTRRAEESERETRGEASERTGGHFWTQSLPLFCKSSEWEWELDEQHAVATILAEAHADLVPDTRRARIGAPAHLRHTVSCSHPTLADPIVSC
jgi:hypothetical protein